MLQDKKILIGVTGSIAAYKLPLLVRQLIKEGAEVRIIMTRSAADFVSPLTLSTLSHAPVLMELFDNNAWSNHVELGRWADVMLVAPLSCNTLSNMAHGACDNLLLATYLSATCPVIAAPAMDEDMWHHGSTKANLQLLAAHGCLIIPVKFGELASGLIGDGRMAEPEEMVGYLNNFFTNKDQLKGKKALVTAGPTVEAIDPVRFISNHSSGKMGYAIAEELAWRGADVTLVSGPVAISTHIKGVKTVNTTTAAEMYEACKVHSNYDIAVMSAAVADYTADEVQEQKIKKSGDELVLKLSRTKDILAMLGAGKKDNQFLVGFALETQNEKENALNKLHRKGADMIVLNSLNDVGAGFKGDTNKITLLYKNGSEKAFEVKSKKEVAKDIIDSIIEAIK